MIYKPDPFPEIQVSPSPEASYADLGVRRTCIAQQRLNHGDQTACAMATSMHRPQLGKNSSHAGSALRGGDFGPPSSGASEGAGWSQFAHRHVQNPPMLERL